MDIPKELFWFFSSESYSIDLPVQCRYIKLLEAKDNREAILIECNKKIDIYGTRNLILVPKHEGASFFYFKKNDDAIFAYVLDGTNFIDKNKIDLSKPKLVIDWGGISISETTANIWQVNIEDIQASKNEVHKHLRKK